MLHRFQKSQKIETANIVHPYTIKLFIEQFANTNSSMLKYCTISLIKEDI